jgi:hypothetical protein
VSARLRCDPVGPRLTYGVSPPRAGRDAIIGLTTFSVERFTKMAASATSQIKTHEQIEYEQGLLLENCVPYGAMSTLGLTEDIYADEHRKPPLSEQTESRTKSAAG